MGRERDEKIKDNLKILGMLLPFIVLITFTFFLGTIEMIKESLGYIPFIGLDDYTLKYYSEVLSDINFYKALGYTLYISILPMLISLFFGTFFAIQIYLKNKSYDVQKGIIQIPIVISYTVYIFFVIILFMQTGFVSRVLNFLNMVNNPQDFPLMIYDKYGIGIFLVYILKQIPFVFLIISTSLLKVDKKLIDVALNLGATKIRGIFTIILPLIKSSIFTAGLLCFAFNFGSYEVSYLLLNPKFDTLPMLAYKEYMNTDITNRPYAMVINTLILLVSCILLFRYLIYSSKIESKNRG